MDKQELIGLAYDEDARVLEAQYPGVIHRYHEVPKDVFEALARSQDVAAFIARELLPRFHYEHLSVKDAERAPLGRGEPRTWTRPLRSPGASPGRSLDTRSGP